MADRKISDLTALTTPASGDFLPIVDISEAAAASKNKRITIEELMRGVPDGTAAAPGIAFETDPNTGIYSPGADQLAVATNGTGRLFVDANGNVGVGTSSPANFAGFVTLALADSSGAEVDFIKGSTIQGSLYNANDIFYVESKSTVPTAFVTNGSERLRITSAGLVGIGTSSPNGPIHVLGSADTGTIHYFGTSSGAANADVAINLATSGNASRAQISAKRVGSSPDGLLQFSTQRSGSLQTRMTINETGLVGIGTASPAQLLHLNSPSANATQWIAAGVGYTSNLSLLANGSGGGLLLSSATDSSASIINSLNAALTFGTNNTERFRCDSSGRLLVGTSTSVNAGTSSPATVQIKAEVGLVIRRNSTTGEANFTLARSRNATDGSYTILNNNDPIGSIRFAGDDGTDLETQAARIDAVVDGTPSANDMPGRLVFSVTAAGAAGPTERMRIGNKGNTTITSVADNDAALRVDSNGTSGTQYGIYIETGNDQNDATRTFLGCVGGATTRAQIRSNGGLANYQANDVNLSDINVKKDISPAGDTWDCVKQWEIVNYRYNDQSDDADLNLGVIAQQVAESCPEVITVFQEAKEATEDAPAQEERLGVKEQQMYWMAIKALQEAIARIETLETEVAALKGA
jgi:hypothetical protein